MASSVRQPASEGVKSPRDHERLRTIHTPARGHFAAGGGIVSGGGRGLSLSSGRTYFASGVFHDNGVGPAARSRTRHPPRRRRGPPGGGGAGACPWLRR